MRTIIKNVYTYSELSDEAKQRALESYRANDYQHEYAWSDEYRNTMEAFCNLFPVRVNNWQISSYSYSFIDHDFTGDDSEKELTGLALAKHLLYHYEDALYQGKYYGHLSNKEKDGTLIEKSPTHPAGVRHVKRHSKVIKEPRSLTGYCADGDIMAPLYKALDGKYSGTFDDLLGDCFDSFKDSWINDMEYQDSDEYIADHLDANNYEFDQDGNIV